MPKLSKAGDWSEGNPPALGMGWLQGPGSTLVESLEMGGSAAAGDWPVEQGVAGRARGSRCGGAWRPGTPAGVLGVKPERARRAAACTRGTFW